MPTAANGKANIGEGPNHFRAHRLGNEAEGSDQNPSLVSGLVGNEVKGLLISVALA